MEKKSSTEQFPPTLYVYLLEKGTDSEFLNAERDPTNAPDGEHVAIYELKEVKTKRVDHSIE